MSQANDNVATPKYAWAILGLAYLAMFMPGVNLNKVAPLIPNLMETFSASLSDTGFLTSALGLTAIICALPSGIILQRLGPRISGTVAFALIVLGAALGAVSGGFGFLLFTRVLEGIGGAVLMVVAPAIVAMWFPPHRLGTAMGIWGTSAPIVGSLTMGLVPIMELAIGWRGVWWVSAGLALVGLVVYWVFIRPAPGLESSQDAPPGETPSAGRPPLRKALANRNLWLLAMGMLLSGGPIVTLFIFYPTFLTTERGFLMSQAGPLVGTSMLFGLLAGPLAGWISDTVGSRKWFLFVCFILLFPLYGAAFMVPGGMIRVTVIMLIIVASSFPVVLMAAVPEALEDVNLVPIGMAVVTISVNLGIILGPPFFGYLVDKVGWVNTGYVFMLLPAVGIVCMGMYKEEKHADEMIN